LPIYEYRCENGHNFEVLQSMSDEPVHVCEVCGAPVQRVYHPVAVHFKGSGFYTTDYGGSRTGASSDSKDSKGDSSDSKPDTKKEPAKAESSSSSSSGSGDSSKSSSGSSSD
jgi:putative FmdB family regulatory protein